MFENKGELEAYCLSKDKFAVGVDEVGRGCIAGPVVAAAVILDYNKLFALDEKTLGLIRDSKTLSAKQRDKILPVIKEIALSNAVAESNVAEVESLGILQATFKAMTKAISQIKHHYDIVLTDGKQCIPGLNTHQKAIVKGDSLVYAIAAASILAKQTRDKYMHELANSYPEYGFEAHVGYGTKKHMDALKTYGVTPIHRKNFAPVRRLVERV